MRLTVDYISPEEVYKDMARIPEIHRIDTKGEPVREARICKVKVLGKSKLLALRGMQGCQKPNIYIDAKTRDDLGVQPKSEYDFELHPVGLPGEFLWAWRATDPIYRIPARIALLSFLLGVIGLGLGIIGFFLSVK